MFLFIKWCIALPFALLGVALGAVAVFFIAIFNVLVVLFALPTTLWAELKKKEIENAAL